MKRLIAPALAMLLAYSPLGFLTTAAAVAQQAKVIQEPDLNTAKTTVDDCLTILAGLNEIDGKHPVVVNAGKPNEQVIETVYEFGNGQLRQDIARNIGLLSVVQHDQQAAAQKVLMEVSKGLGEIRQPEATASKAEKDEFFRQSMEYNNQVKAMIAKPCSIDNLTRIKIDDLKLKKNEIRAAALSAIGKILDK